LDQNENPGLYCHYPYLPTVASANTARAVMSSIHLILKPPLSSLHLVKMLCRSLVLRSGEKLANVRIRVTDAETMGWELDGGGS
jgi:hypothetical protein